MSGRSSRTTRGRKGWFESGSAIEKLEWFVYTPGQRDGAIFASSIGLTYVGQAPLSMPTPARGEEIRIVLARPVAARLCGAT
jgi:hypothetical protein